ALAGQRRIVGLLPAELQHVAAQVAGEVADHFLALALVDPDALDAPRVEATLAVVGLDLDGAERRPPQAERALRVHLLRRRRAGLAPWTRHRLVLVGARRRRTHGRDARSQDSDDPRNITGAHRIR